MGASQIVAFCVFVLVAAGTPGPSNVLLLATGARVGVLRGLPCMFGVSVGMGAMMFIVGFGLGSVITANHHVLYGLRFAGAAVLLWLAWKIATAETGSDDGGAPPVGFLGAALFQWVNPKSWLVSVSAAATYLSAGTGSVLVKALLLGLLFVAASLPVCLAWLAFGAAVQRLLGVPGRRRMFNRCMGLLLAASVVTILF